MKPMAVPLLIAVILLMFISAGCTQPGGNAVPVSPPAPVSPAPAPATLTPVPATTVPVLPSPSASPSSVPMNATTSPASSPVKTSTVPVTAYQRFQDRFYSVDYPAGWQQNETSLPVREYNHTPIGCRWSYAYNLNQDLRMFFPAGGDALFYSSIVDSDRDIWPRNEHRQIDYADLVNSILGNPDYCANTPAGAFTISGVVTVPLNGVSFEGTRVDFGKIDSLGKTLGMGSMYVVTGNHRHGVFTYYSATGESTAWKPAADYMLNTITLDPGF